MPVFTVVTNVKQEDFPEGWMSEATDLIANLLEKPKMYVIIHVIANQQMTMAGTNDPCATITLASIGKISEAENRINLTSITEFIEKTIKVPKNRMYIFFKDVPRDMIGHNGNLFK